MTCKISDSDCQHIQIEIGIQNSIIFSPYHGYAMREVSVNSTSLYETN